MSCLSYCYYSRYIHGLILTGILNSVFFNLTYSQSQQNKIRIGTFTKCEVLTTTSKTGVPQNPKDTVIISGSTLKIPIKAEFDNTSFNGTLEIEFPRKTPQGTWTKGPSRITLDQPLSSQVTLKGTWDCTKSPSPCYYTVNAFTAASPAYQPCPQSGEFVTGKVNPGSSAEIEAKGICSFSLFDINAPNYDFEAMTKIFFTGCGFDLTTGNITVKFNINTRLYYSFDRVTGPLIGVNNSAIEFKSDPKGPSQTLKIKLSNAGSGQLDFNIAVSTASGVNWLEVSPAIGSIQEALSTTITITINPSSLETGGEYTGQLSISATNATNSPVTIPITLKINENKLLLKFDPPKVKCSESTTLKISIVDKNNNLVNDYEGKAEIRLLKDSTTDKITKLAEYQNVSITKGKAEPIIIYTPKEPFNRDSAITNRTVLSGKIFIEVKPENIAIRKDTAKLTVYSPIDFYIDRIEVQQGIKDPDKDVRLDYKPDEKRTFPARNFIAGHETIIRAFTDYRKTIDIPFSRMDYGIMGEIKIFRGGITQAIYNMPVPGLNKYYDFFIRDTFSVQEKINLQDALFRRLNTANIEESGQYDFKVNLVFENLYQDESDIPNNSKNYSSFFAATGTYRILGILGWLEGENPPNLPYDILYVARLTFPIEERKLILTDPNANKYVFKKGFYYLSNTYWNNLLYILNRYNEQSVPEEQCKHALMVATNDLLDKFASNARGVAEGFYGKVCVIKQVSLTENTVAHELGHLFGLKETYSASLAYYNPLAYLYVNGDPNPQRSDADKYGNWIEDGNINMAEQKLALLANRYHDIMSATTGKWSGIDRATWEHLYKEIVFRTQKSALKSNVTDDGYIVVSGSISDKDSIILNPVIRMATVPSVDDTLKGNYLIAFYNNENKQLASYKFNVVYFIPEVAETTEVPFSLNLPFTKTTVKMKILKQLSDGGLKVVLEKAFSENKPVVNIVSPVKRQQLSGNYTIKWTSSDADDNALTYDIIYSPDGKTKSIIATNLTSTTYNWNSALSQGSTNGFITIIANDGINDGKATVDSLTVFNNTAVINRMAEGYELEQNYPNPFSNYTTIGFSIPKTCRSTIKIFDLFGKEIETLLDEKLTQGRHTVRWDATGLSPGVYFCRLSCEGYVCSKKLLLKNSGH